MVRCPEPLRSSYLRLLLGPGSSGGRVVLFGSRNREYVTDSSYSVYVALRNHQEVRAIWVGSREQVRRLRAEGGLAVRAAGLQHRLLMHLAVLAVISYQVTDVARDVWHIPQRLPFLYLGHGKSIKRSGSSSKGHRSSAYQRRAQLLREQTLLAVASSPVQADLVSEAYGLDRDAVSVLGEARTDVLVAAARAPAAPGIRRILYSPTWRQGADGPPTQFFPFEDFDLDALTAWLDRAEVELILRPHPKEMRHPAVVQQTRRLERASRHIRRSTAVDRNALYAEMARASVLVSDYSSVVEEFLLCDRPVLLVPYDYERFSRRQGFLMTLEESRVGPSVHDFSSLLDALARALDGEDPFREQRRVRRELVHAWLDGNSTARVSEAVVALTAPRLRGLSSASERTWRKASHW
jgi:CDP-glycerol glycerophosphotransferase (TagB/SpsB family)